MKELKFQLLSMDTLAIIDQSTENTILNEKVSSIFVNRKIFVVAISYLAIR